MQRTTASPNDDSKTRQAADAGGEVATEAADHARQLGDSASQKANEVASHATAGAHDVARHARQQAGAVTGVAADQVGQLVEQARGELQRTARERTEQIGGLLGDVASQLRALAEGRPEDAGRTVDYVGQAVDATERLATRLRQGGPEGLVDDVTRFARRRPGLFLAGAAVAGFGVGRLLRAGKDSGSLQSLAAGPDQTSTGGVTGPGVPAAPPVGRPDPATADTGVIELRDPAVPPAAPVTEPIRGAADRLAADRAVAEGSR